MLKRYLPWALRAPDDNEGGDSSTPQDAPDDKEQKDDSSTPEPDDKPGKTLADVVRETAEKAAPSTEEEPPEDEVEDDKPEAKPEEKTDDADDAEKPDDTEDGEEEETTAQAEKDKDEVPERFSKHPAWQRIIKERDEAASQVEASKPLLQRAQAIDSFMANNGLDDKSLSDALEIAALMNVDPLKAKEKLRPYWEACERYAGDALPDDLRIEVEGGTLTAERAKELASLRMQHLTRDQRAKQNEQTAAVRQQQEVIRTIATWEQSKVKTDPDFTPKKNGDADGLLELTTAKFLTLAQAERAPLTTQRAVAIAEQAYADVKRAIQRFAPKPPTKKPALSSTRSSATNGKTTEPKTLREVVFRAAAAGAAASRR